MIKDSSLTKLKTYRKYKDLYDHDSLEGKCSFWGAVIMCVIMYNIPRMMDIEGMNQIFEALTKDVAIALIGFLGFTVSGLAILTGVISKKEISRISAANKLDRLEKILLSFYLLGVVIAFAIVIHFVLYIFSVSNLSYNLYVVVLLTFVISYLDIFIVFYSVKLIGNCLDIFFIVNESNDEEERTLATDLQRIYMRYRLTALENVCLKKMKQEDVEEYRKIIETMVNSNSKYNQELLEMYRQHFRIKDE